jgi:undecaprenyl pyrophosphate synthase
VLRAVRRREVEHVDEDPHRFLLSAHVPAVDLVIRTGGTGA